MSSPDAIDRSADVNSPFARLVRVLLGAQLVFLLALAQVLFAGYQIGVGNQSIQIPFLKHWADPSLYANDPMVQGTLGSYHTYFFRILAAAIGGHDVDRAYFWLHVGTTAAVIAAAYWLGRAMFASRGAGAVLVVLMLAGHHRALAGDDLYSPGFTHTWAVFPLAIAAMALLYKNWLWAAFALAGLIFNLHALTAGYLVVMFTAWALMDYREARWRQRLAGMVAVFVLCALPTLVKMAGGDKAPAAPAVAGQPVDAQQAKDLWLTAMKVRSADHSFPSSWWTAGSSDVPRFAVLAGLAAVSLSFAMPPATRRKSLWMAAGVGSLFLAGYVFAELWPSRTVVRAQLYRSSRLLSVLMLAHVAHGIVSAWSLARPSRLWRRAEEPAGEWRGSSDVPFPPAAQPTPVPVLPINAAPSAVNASAPVAVLEIVLAVLTLIVVAVPGMMAWSPWLLLAAAVVAVATGRLAWPQAAAAGAALLVALLAWTRIDFHVPGLGGHEFTLEGLRQQAWRAGGALWVAVAFAAAVWAVLRAPIGPRAKLCGAAVAALASAPLGLHAREALADVRADGQRHWVAAQLWAANNTPRDAVFLTPPQQAGFRIYSGRAVACEWRDGTQLYFSPAFAADWWRRLTAIRPAIYDASGTHEVSARSLEKMSDAEIVDLAQSQGASYVVLPRATGAENERSLRLRYANDHWAVYEPEVLDDQDRFIETVALPNIEKHRKSDVRLELRDADGRTVTGGEFAVAQTRQAFGFGVSIPFFAEPAGDAGPDFEPPVVTEAMLRRVKDVFNYTVIPFSAKWQRLEPEEGERRYEELDRYVDWCAKNGIEMEFHYLSGFMPRWLRQKGQGDQREAWLRHCRETVARYHDRIKVWQVVNDRYMMNYADEAFREIRAKYPDLKLGLSNCTKFYSPYKDERARAALMTGQRDVEELQDAGMKVDYYAPHGHSPHGAWPDMRQVYEVLDEFARMGVRLRVTEATLDTGLRLISDHRREAAWTPELAADYFERYYTVLFSHPAMDAINYWDLGPSIVRGARGGGSIEDSGTGKAGLLDPETAEPRPVYNRLKHLIREKWMTRLSGQVANDGAVAFRGFHGDYEVTVRTAAGKELKGKFTVKPGGANAIQVRLTDGAARVVKTD